MDIITTNPKLEEKQILTSLEITNPNNKNNNSSRYTDKTHSNTKWIILFLSSLLLCGDFYSYDTSYACKELLRERFVQFTDKEYQYMFNLLYTVYQIPNIFLPFLNGIIAQKLGDRRMLTILGIMIFAGSTIVTIGVHYTSFTIMLMGRFLYAIGGDSITVSQWTLVLEYFEESEGWIYIMTGAGSSLNFYLSPLLANKYGVVFAFDTVVIVCAFALILRYLLYLCDKNVQKNILNNKKMLNSNQEAQRFWYIFFFGITMQTNISSFLYFCAGYLQQKWWPTLDPAISYDKATEYNLLSSIISLIAIPFFGKIADKFILYNTFALVAPLILALSYICYMNIKPLIPVILYTCSSAISYCATWSCLTRSIPKEKMGLATGLFYSAMNTGMSVMPTINTFIQNTWGYNQVFNLLFIFIGISLFSALKFIFEDRRIRSSPSKEKNILESPEKEGYKSMNMNVNANPNVNVNANKNSYAIEEDDEEKQANTPDAANDASDASANSANASETAIDDGEKSMQ